MATITLYAIIFVDLLAFCFCQIQCPDCPPGHYLQRCDNGRSDCEVCPENTFNARPGKASKCTDCSVQCPIGQEIVQACTKTSNIKCECKDGYFYKIHAGSEGVCTEYQKCSDNEYIVQEGTKKSDRVCERRKDDTKKSTSWFTIIEKTYENIPGGAGGYKNSNILVMITVLALGYLVYRYIRRRPHRQHDHSQ